MIELVLPDGLALRFAGGGAARWNVLTVAARPLSPEPEPEADLALPSQGDREPDVLRREAEYEPPRSWRTWLISSSHRKFLEIQGLREEEHLYILLSLVYRIWNQLQIPIEVA